MFLCIPAKIWPVQCKPAASEYGSMPSSCTSFSPLQSNPLATTTQAKIATRSLYAMAGCSWSSCRKPLNNLVTFCLFLVSWHMFCLIPACATLISLNLYLIVFSFVPIAISSYRDNEIGSDRDKPQHSSNIYNGTCF